METNIMKDLILGSFSGYSYNIIEPWVRSIRKTDFDGDVVVIVGNTDSITIQKLIFNDIKIVFMADILKKCEVTNLSNIPIHSERFFFFYEFLKQHKHDYRYAIVTDMKDVIFQSNPSRWLSYNKINDIVISTEGLLYKDEPWGNQNLQDVCPYYYNDFKDKIIYNVGVIAGNLNALSDLYLNIYKPSGFVEQAYFNVYIHTYPIKDYIQFCQLASGFCCNLGTLMDPNKMELFRPLLLEKEPIFKDGLFKTHDEIPFVIAHQWERCDSNIVDAVRKLYT